VRRRTFLTAVGSAGAVGTAGVAGGATGTYRGERTLSDPTVHADSPRRRSLSFTADGEEVGSLGVSGSLDDGVIDLGTEIWHREGTRIESIALGVWMPPADASSTAEAAEVAVVSPVEGDSSPPPDVSLSTPRREPGTLVEVDDLDDLADETISTLDLVVRPGAETEPRVVVDAALELREGGWFGTDYALDGRLEVEFPALD
jgi:hypothetical protein